MHSELKLLTLHQRRELHLGSDCYNHVKNPDSSLHKYFKKKAVRATRSGENIIVPNLKRKYGRYAYLFRGPNTWNSLPVELKNSETSNQFKNMYHKQLMRDENHPMYVVKSLPVT